MNIMKVLGHGIVATSGAIALTPIFIGEKLCLAGEVSSRGIAKAALWSEKKCAAGVAGCQNADKHIRHLVDEKKVIVGIKSARTLEELSVVPEAKLDNYSDEVIEMYKVKEAELLAKAEAAADEAFDGEGSPNPA
jgi:hypothetical protein